MKRAPLRGFKGTAAPLPLCLEEIPSASAVCSPAAAVCSVLPLQLAQKRVMLLIFKGDSFCCSSVQCLTATCTKRSPTAASSDLGSLWPSVVVAAAGCGFFTLLLLIILLLQMLQCRSVHTHALAHSITLSSYTNPLTHIHALSLSLSPLSFSLSRSLARSLAHPPSVSHVHMYNFFCTHAYSLKLHTLALSPSRLSALSLT